MQCGVKTAVTQGCTRYCGGSPEEGLRCRDVQQKEHRPSNHKAQVQISSLCARGYIISPLRALVFFLLKGENDAW